jgi:hypothetical protein
LLAAQSVEAGHEARDAGGVDGIGPKGVEFEGGADDEAVGGVVEIFYNGFCFEAEPAGWSWGSTVTLLLW